MTLKKVTKYKCFVLRKLERLIFQEAILTIKFINNERISFKKLLISTKNLF